MAGRGGSRRIPNNGLANNSPRTAVSSPSSRFLSKSSPTMGGVGNATSSTGLSIQSDKTVCQYCGVSYLTISEMRSLQTTVREQEEQLNHFKLMMQEHLKLKDLLGTIRKSHMGELMKQEENNQRVDNQNKSLKEQLEILQNELKESKQKHSDLKQKYAISSEDSRQQEEVIAQLRDEMLDREDTLAENASLREKNRNLESALHKVLVQYREVTASGLESEKSGRSTAHSMDKGDHIRNKTTQDKKPEQSEWGNLRSQQKSSNILNGKSKGSSISSIETHDLKRQVSILSERLGGLTEEHTNCADTHNLLRETIDKLKIDNMNLHEDFSSLKVKFEERAMDYSNLEARLEGLQNENSRLKDVAKELDNQLHLTIEQSKIIKKQYNPNEVERLQKNVSNLQNQFEKQKREMDALNVEFEKELAQAHRETTMEKERADSCLAISVSEREDVEKRWEERWDRHQSSLNEQLNSLKANHEDTLRQTKEHEIALQKDLKALTEKFEKSKEAWEAYRTQLQEQINQWKVKYEQRQQDMESTRRAKVEVEVLYQGKMKELDVLQEMVRDGCEERQELQKKVEGLEESLEEIKSQGITAQRFSTYQTSNICRDKISYGFPPGMPKLTTTGLLKYSNSDITLPKVSLGPDTSSWSSIGSMGNPPDTSHHNRSDISSVSTLPISLNFFTVGKGKKASVSSVSGKDKNTTPTTSNSSKIGQQKGTPSIHNTISKASGSSNTLSRKSNK